MFEELQGLVEEAQTYLSILKEEIDPDLFNECQLLLKTLEEKASTLETWLLLNEKYDDGPCYISLKAGAGGTDAQDWTEILLRMYTKWFDKKQFNYHISDISQGEEAGLKSVTLLVSGDFAYGLLKQEVGIHRLVRISPFNANGKRQTSFAAVEVIPDIKDTSSELKIPSDELKIDTYRASGAGGQHINKTDSAVRITHLPTKTVAQCQSSRSQAGNKEEAMRMLMAKLTQQLQAAHKQTLNELKGDEVDIAWGHQIRSYIFHPYKLVKDHRTNVDSSQLQHVLDGDLNPFIQASLHQKNSLFEQSP